MDTDSAYMALAGSLDEVIKPHLRSEFYTHYGKWFPRLACDTHHQDFIQDKMQGKNWVMKECCKKINKYDQRTPGLFKEEFRGVGIISLNSKTYFCWEEETSEDTDLTVKYRSKGLSRKQNKLTRDQFMSVLSSKNSVSGENRGFCKKDNQIFTYSQQRSGLSYMYAKRLVLEDGVTTLPLHV